MTSFRINLHEAIYSLADALDLVGVTHIHHGKRVAYIAAEIAKRAGWNQARLNDLFQAAILHDCGVSKTLIHARLAQFEWENEAEHCALGADLLQSCELLSRYSNFILHHHTHWDQLAGLALNADEKMAANCIYLADRVDITCLSASGDSSNLLLVKDDVRARIFEKRGTWFEPSLVDRFMEVSSSEGFWFALEGDHASGYVSRWVFDSAGVDIDFSQLRSLIRVFSRIVDAKSTFTREHSEGVAALARHLGELFELPERTCDMLELAGLLHDLGKLRIPDEMLEKPAKLTEREYSEIKRHSFDTYNILKNIHGLEEVALWAGQHHERLDGSGYPYRHSQDEISFESRIIATADVFQALAQNRPYRGSLPPAEILSILKEEALSSKLDSRIVRKIERHFDACHRIALAAERQHTPSSST